MDSYRVGTQIRVHKLDKGSVSWVHMQYHFPRGWCPLRRGGMCMWSSTYFLGLRRMWAKHEPRTLKWNITSVSLATRKKNAAQTINTNLDSFFSGSRPIQVSRSYVRSKCLMHSSIPLTQRWTCGNVWHFSPLWVKVWEWMPWLLL